MKRFIALAFFLIALTAAATAQNTEAKPAASAPPSGANDAAAREATEKLVAKYTLNADQSKEMYTIQLRKLRNRASFASLETTNRSLYLSKLESLQKGTLSSIRRILRTKEQVELYQKTQSEVRNQRAVKRKELTGQNISKDDMQAAMLDIYSE